MTQESIQPFLDWISAHPSWSGFIVFLISLSESLAIVGLLVPGVVLMTAIGAMMGAGILPFWETLSWAILGAIAGDGISYWLGYHYHERLRGFWPFKQFPKFLARGEQFFQNHGGKSIIFGRFVGPVRPMIPVIAGMMDMTPKRFLFFNVVSAFVWAPLYSLPGILIGASLGTLSTEVASRAGLLILLFLLALWLVYEFLFLTGAWIIKSVQAATHRVWQVLHKFGWLRWLSPQQGSEEGQLGVSILFCLSLAAFGVIYRDVINAEGIAGWNEPVYQVLRALYNDKLISALGFLTGIADPWVLWPPVLAIALWLGWRAYYKAAACWLLTIGIGFIIGYALTLETAIQPPEGLLYLPEQYAFPSLHALLATLTFGLAAALIQTTVSVKHRWIPWAIAIPAILWVALSQVYLGMHWFSDILGSLSLGLVFVSLGIFIYRKIEARPLSRQAFLVPGLLVFCLTLSAYTLLTYPNTRQELVRQWATHELSQKNWWQNKGETEALYRTGAFKRQATIFDVQWLGRLETIEHSLVQTGWKVIPKLTPKTAVLLLASDPGPLNFPVMPKFHRDRLPILTVAKTITSSQRERECRLVLQLWQSDYYTDQKMPLWVGTLRLETLVSPLPWINLYLESPTPDQILKDLEKALVASPEMERRITPSRHKPAHKTLLIYSP